MPVRSKRLFGPVVVGTNGSVVYTVPAGETALLKGLECGAGGLGTTLVSWYIGALSVANRIHITEIPNNGWASESGLFLVLQPLEQLRAVPSAGNITVSGFGAELEGVAD